MYSPSKVSSSNSYTEQPWVHLVHQWWLISIWSTFEELALGPEVPVPIMKWKRYVDDVFSIIPKGKRDILLNYLNSIDPHIKFTVEQPNADGGHTILGHIPPTKR